MTELFRRSGFFFRLNTASYIIIPKNSLICPKETYLYLEFKLEKIFYLQILSVISKNLKNCQVDPFSLKI